MKKTVLTMLVLLMIAMPTVQGCASKDAESPEPGKEDAGLVLTLEELAKYDGKNGNSAYIAIDGVIYDVTNVPQWKNGEHNGYSAGKDLTDEIKNISPHGVSKLKSVPVVGTLAE